MAHSIGKVFVELDLDPSRYMRSQQTIRKEAENGAKVLEKNFKNLGIKSGAMYDLMRAQAEKSFEAIKRSSKVTADDIVRAERAKAERIKQINAEQFNKRTSMLSAMKKNWLATTAAIYGAWRLVSKGIEEASNIFNAGMQSAQMKKAFSEIAGGAQLAEKELAFLRQTSDQLGQNFWDLQGAYKGLLAASKDTALQGKATQDVFLAVSRAATTLGLSSEKMKLTLYAVEQMMSKGKISAEELRRQMGDNLPGAFSTAAKAMNMTTLEFDKALKTGTVMAEDFLPKFAQALKEKYSGEVVESVRATNKWNEALMDLKVNIAESGFLDKATEILKELTATIKDRNFQESMKDFANGMLSIAGTLATIAKYAGLKSITETISEAVQLAREGKIDMEEFWKAGFLERQKMVEDASKGYGTIRGEIKRMIDALDDGNKKTKALAGTTGELGDIADLTAADLRKIDEAILKIMKRNFDGVAASMNSFHDAVLSVEYAINEIQYDELLAETEAQASLVKDVMDDLNKSLEEQSELFDYTVFGDSADQNVQNLMKSLNELLKTYDDIGKAQKDLAKDLEKINLIDNIEDREAAMELYYKKEKKLAMDSTQAQIGAYGQLFGALSQMFDEQSSMQKAMLIAEQAMAVVKGVMVVLNAGAQGDGYTVAARMAAAASAVAAILSIAGIAFSGGGGGGIPEEPVKPPSTVLGADAGTGSESIINSLGILQDQNDEQLWALYDIYNATKDLNQSIMKFVVGILQGTVGGGGLSGMEYKIPGFSIGSIGSGTITGYERGAAPSAEDGADKFDEWAKEYFQWALAGFDELNEVVLDSLTRVFRNIGETFKDLAIGLGVDVQDVLDYVFPNIHLDLTGLSESEIEDAVINYFSSMTDDMATELFGDIVGQYQQIGEGMYETAVRVLAEKETILSALEMTRQGFAGTAEEAVYFTQALIELSSSFEDLTEDASTYFEQYLTEAEQLAWLTGNLAEGYAAIGQEMPATRQAFKDLVSGLDLTTYEGQQLYVALLDIAGATDAYYDALEKANQTIIDAKRKLTGTEDSGAIADIEARYGLSAGTINKSFALKYIEQFLNASEEDIRWFAQQMGVSVEDLVNDIMTLSDIFDEAGEAAINATHDFTNLIESIRGIIKGIQDQIDLTAYDGTSSSYYMGKMLEAQSQIESLLGSGDTQGAMEALYKGASYLQNWYNTAVQEATKAAQEAADAQRNALNEQKEALNEQLSVARAFGSLVDQIEGVVQSIKYSPLNVNLPTMKAQTAKDEYTALRDAAMASGTVEDYQKFVSFAQTALEQYQARYKSSKTYQDFYATVMSDLEAAGANAEAKSYEEGILNELKSIDDQLSNIEVTVDLSDINDQFASLSASVEAYIDRIQTLDMVLNIDWENWDGEMATAFEWLGYLVKEYGWSHPFTLEFVAQWAKECETINDAATALEYLVDNDPAGWDSAAALTFIASWAEECDDITDAKKALAYLVDMTGWGSAATLKLILGLYENENVGAGQITSFADIDAWLESMGITDENLKREFNVQIVYDLVTSGKVDVESLADAAYAKMTAAAALAPSDPDRIQALKYMKSLGSVFGAYSAYDVGFQIGALSSAAKMAGWSPEGAGQAAVNMYNKSGGWDSFAEGGLVTSPTFGMIGEAGYPEAVIPMKDGMNIPVKWINGGSTQEGANRTINLTVQIAGKEFEGEVKSWADEAIVMRVKHGKMNDTRKMLHS